MREFARFRQCHASYLKILHRSPCSYTTSSVVNIDWPLLRHLIHFTLNSRCNHKQEQCVSCVGTTGASGAGAPLKIDVKSYTQLFYVTTSSSLKPLVHDLLCSKILWELLLHWASGDRFTGLTALPPYLLTSSNAPVCYSCHGNRTIFLFIKL